ncbi:MAG: FG-GAP repeat protein, partial [Verrucomicrobia bacterium]|nr:FG-GAP repeat protein [Verrucomicrobiota bacterium]
MRNPLILYPVGLLLLGATLGAQSPFPVEIIESETALGSQPGATLRGFTMAFDGERAAATSSRLSDPLPRRLELFRRGQTEWQREGELNVRGIGNGFGMQLEVSADLLALGDPEENRVYLWKARDVAPPVRNAWNTFDLITGSGSLHYARTFTPAQHALAASEGWRLTLRARMVDDFGGSPACYLDFTDANNRRWLLFFDLDAEGDLIVSLGGLEVLQLTNDGQGWADYHQHEIHFRPSTGTADYYFNGQQLNSAPWASTPITGLNGVRWGNGSTAGRGSMNFSLVEFRTAVTGEVLARYDAGLAASSAVVPHPTTQGWTENRTGANHPGRPVAGDVIPLWKLEAVLTETDYSESRFGASLDLEGDTLVVGHPHAFDGQGSDGAAHVFVRQEGGVWTEQQTFWSPLPASTEDFGMLVALAGDTLVIGARSWESDELGATAHVYVREGETWSLQSELLGLPGVAPHFPATALAVHGNLVAVGARSVPQSGLGAVYIFEREGEVWSLAGELRADPPDTFGGFGSSVATDGERIVVGHDDASSAHLFARDLDRRWVQVHRFDLPDWAHLTDVALADGRFALMVAPPTNDYDDLLVYHVDYANAAGLAAYARRVLYFPEAAASGSMNPNSAVFRYKHLLYTKDHIGIRPDYQAMPALFGDAERQLAEMVKQELARGLALQPEDPTLGNLVLDLYYDTAVAQAVLAKETLVRASRIRYGPPFAPEPPHNGFAIDLEIPEYQSVLTENRRVLEGYFELFSDDLGLPGNPPLGHELFRRWVPGRPLTPAEYLDDNGNPQPVIGEPTLFDGYKDLVLLFDLLRDHGRAAAELA